MKLRDSTAFGLFLLVRLGSVLVVQTFFVPDEYWQSLEVAHKITFGYGYLTWEWIAGIRSYLYPLVFSGLFAVLKCLQVDSPLCLIYGPRILQALLAAYADLCFYRWSGTKKWAAFNIATAWFWFYVGSRTLINTFENALTMIALSQFPWPGSGKGNSSTFLWIVACLFVVRPTAAIIWLPLCLYHVLTSPDRVSIKIVKRYIPIGTCVLASSVLLDSWAHGSWVVTGYEFLKFNILKDVGSWYGSQPWYWYLTSGLPAVLGIQIVPFAFAVKKILSNRSAFPNDVVLLGTIAFTVAVYSALPHKEFRFLLPLLPICLKITSQYLSTWSYKANTITLWLVASLLFLGNFVPAFYVSFIHQRGTLDVMGPLREISLKNPDKTSLLFLMPCHSTPFYSHLHVNVPARFLTCEPNWNSTETWYKDEADRFYDNPQFWLRKHYPVNSTLPTHVICFDVLKPAISDFLSRYKTTHQLFHTSIESGRIGRNVLINERIDVQ